MFPIRDVNPVRSTPVVNYLLILANVVGFVYARTLPPTYETDLALIPVQLVTDPPSEAFTVLTSMFMHANLMHLVGNLWFLWIFGDNVEDALGHVRYLAFYLLGGLVAAFTQVIFDVGSPIPMVGASGAIAAVTAAYVLLYPRAPILIVNPIPLFWLFFGFTFLVPAWVVAGEFFLVNLFMGVQTLGRQALGAPSQGGVAVFAHLGGFFAGLIAVRPMLRGRPRKEHRSWEGWRPPNRPRRSSGW
jgi:membrane associated rhomboid family serine protease